MDARILVVDDDKIIRKVLGKTLQREGLTVTTVVDGLEALKIIKEEDFELVISDVKMPNLSGLELLSSVYKTHPDLPFIMITGYTETNFVLEAMNLGVKKFFKKPVNLEMLIHAIRIVLINKQKLKKIANISPYIKEYADLEVFTNVKTISTIINLLTSHIRYLEVMDHISIKQIQTALYCAISNAMIHGNKHQSDKKIRIAMKTLPDRLEFEIQDEGDGFDGEKYFNNLDNLSNLDKNNKMGLAIIKTLMDKLVFQNKCTTLKMYKKFSKSIKTDKSITLPSFETEKNIEEFNYNNIAILNHNNNDLSDLEHILSEAGYNIFINTNIEEFTKTIATSKINLILMQISYDLSNKTDFYKLFSVKCPDIPFLVITDEETKFVQAIDALNKGILYFISKPFSKEKILPLFEQLLLYKRNIDIIKNNVKFKIDINFPCEPNLLTSTSLYFSYFLENRLKIPYSVVHNITLALYEALTNAYEHGNLMNTDKNINLEVRFNGKNLLIDVSDEGKGFDISKQNNPLAPENINKISGRGLYIINQIMNQVTFNDKGTTISMRIKI